MDKRWVIAMVVAGVVIVIATVVPAVVGRANGWDGGYYGMMGGGFGWMWMMPVFMIAFWGLVIWAVVAVVQGASHTNGAGPSAPREESALEILKRRYARGEIGKEEFEEKKRALV